MLFETCNADKYANSFDLSYMKSSKHEESNCELNRDKVDDSLLLIRCFFCYIYFF